MSLAGLLASLLVLAVMAGGSLAALNLSGNGTKPAVTLPSGAGGTGSVTLAMRSDSGACFPAVSG